VLFLAIFIIFIPSALFDEDKEEEVLNTAGGGAVICSTACVSLRPKVFRG